MTMDFQEPGEEPLWKVWLIRILVTAMIALTLEYLGKQPIPQTKKSEKQKEVKKPVQHSELSSEVEEETKQREEADNEKVVVLKDTLPLKDDKADQPSIIIAPVEVQPEEIKDEDIYDEGEDEAAEGEEEGENKDDNSKEDDNANPNTPTEVDDEPKTIKFRNKLNNHPGMAGFHRWYDIETSLFRQYNVGRTDGVDVIPPYVKKSRNGQVRVALRVVNELTDPSIDQRINVYWINYLGHEDLKGSIMRGETWYQTTYVEHPWVFRTSDTNEVLLHYIPERVIPHLEEAPTIEEDHPMVGVQRVSIKRPTEQAMRDHHICSIEDKVMPHPASHHFHNPNQAHSWTLLHMQRMEYFTYNPGATLLVKYLTNIAMHPDRVQYRHIRTANRNFASGIWNTAARGLLLAAGFVEQYSHAELGTGEPLARDLVQDVSLVLYRLEQCLLALGQSSSSGVAQPEGADGSGRAGYGRAGQMNLRT